VLGHNASREAFLPWHTCRAAVSCPLSSNL
jgi:hypothetical protein